MAIKEVATNQVVKYALENQTVGNGATVTGAILDTAGYDMGVYFAILCSDWTTTGATMTIYEDDAAGFGTATIVPAAKLIYTAPTIDTAATVEGATIAKLGCFGTKRYLRVSILGDATCALDAAVIAIMNPESRPTAQGGL